MRKSIAVPCLLAWALSGVLLAALPSATRANIVTFASSTAGAPVFNRPIEDLSALSSLGTAVRYVTTRVNVGTSGEYSFLTAAAFDSFSLLYGPSFNAAAPLANALVANDDRTALSTSGFAYALTAGIDYFLVNTAYENTGFGTLISTIAGLGVVTLDPAPALGALPPGLLTYFGDSAADGRFNRPIEDLSGLSAIGTNVPYDRFDFTVGTSGAYSFMTTGAHDTFAILYGSSFDPSAPLTNALLADDDLVSLTTSGLAYSLVAGSRYTLVTTGYENSSSGAFSTLINGPGAIVPDAAPAAVPLPSTALLLVAGLWSMRLARRRRA